MTSVRAHAVEIPEKVRSGEFFAGAHYAWAVELVAPRARALTAEQWARGVFEDSPAVLRAVITAGWRFGLGLRLGPRPSPRYVQGWEIADGAQAARAVAAAGPDGARGPDGPARPRTGAAGPGGSPAADSITLVARSRLLTARNIAVTQDGRVTWVTLVRFERAPARLLWGAARPVHQLTLPYLLGRVRRRAVVRTA